MNHLFIQTVIEKKDISKYLLIINVNINCKMSKVTKRKHVMNEALWDDYELPRENQSIAKVLKSKGNNLHEVYTYTVYD